MSFTESEVPLFSASEREYEPEAFEEPPSSENQVKKHHKRQGRKRFKEPEKHIKSIRKRNRNMGREYVSTSNKVVPEKSFHNINCNCKKNCSIKITENDRKTAFENFWKMGEFSSQNAFLCGLVKQDFAKTHRPRNGSRIAKGITNTYYVNTGGISQDVCKKYFLQTFQISNGRLQRALERARVSFPGEDLRGKHKPINKIPEEQVQKVFNHINSFPAYSSRNTRSRNSNRKYLDSNLNIRLMYNLYKEQCIQEDCSPVSEAIYRKIFHKDFNLHFHTPSKDTCIKRNLLKEKLDCQTDEQQRQYLEMQKDLHLCRAEKAMQSLTDDQALYIIEKDKVYQSYS